MSRTLDFEDLSEAELVEVTVTFLESRERPRAVAPLASRSDVSGVIRADPPSVSFYRFLYDTVGAPWHWYERRELSDAELLAIIEDPKVEVYVVYVRGAPAGYVELDLRVEGDVEVAYFGLMPEFIGRGLGTWLLDFGLRKAWRQGVRRVWLHTCTLDHPSAISMYQRAGLVVYDRKVKMVDMRRARRV